jgi:hypothetical protein
VSSRVNRRRFNPFDVDFYLNKHLFLSQAILTKSVGKRPHKAPLTTELWWEAIFMISDTKCTHPKGLVALSVIYIT